MSPGFTPVRRGFEELVLGESTRSIAVTVTESHLVTFAGLTGDFSAVHLDRTVAESSPYGARVAHGPLVTALASGLFTLADPIDSFALLQSDWRYHLPVLVGDTVHVVSWLAEIRKTSSGGRAVVTHDREVRNQDDLVVVSGTTRLMMEIRTVGAP